jgi:hypothetical protein
VEIKPPKVLSVMVLDCPSVQVTAPNNGDFAGGET